MTEKKRKFNDDEEWNSKVEGKVSIKKKYVDESCFIHCTGSNEVLVKLPTLNSWRKLLEAARIREHGKVLELSRSTDPKEIPIIFYHMNSVEKHLLTRNH